MTFHPFKIVLLGESSVGKTSIVNRLLRNRFSDPLESTIGASFTTYNLSINNKLMNFEIWDTAGQERYNALAPMYYRKSDIALIVYDLTSPDSLDRARRWIIELKRMTDIKLVILVASKYDLVDDKCKLIKDGQKMASDHNIEFMLTSAKTNHNIQQLFNDIGHKMVPYVQLIQHTTLNIKEDNKIDLNTTYCCY